MRRIPGFCSQPFRVKGLHKVWSATAREVLGLVIGLLFAEPGEGLESQDRTCRVGYDKLVDTSGRVEFTSRIYVLSHDSRICVSAIRSM